MKVNKQTEFMAANSMGAGQRDHADFTPGWWISPSILIGALGWITIFCLLF